MLSFDVAASQVRGMLAAFSTLGLDAPSLAHETDLDLACLTGPDVRVPAGAVLRLWTAAERRYGSLLLGLDAASRAPYGTFEMMDYLLGSSDSAGEALTRLARYARLCGSGLGYQVARSDEAYLVTLQSPHSVEPWPEGLVEYVWTLVVARLRRRLGAAFTPTLRLRHAPRGPLEAYRVALGSVQHECAGDELVIPKELWTHENLDRDPQLVESLERYAVEVLGRLPDEDDPIAVLRRQLIKALRSGEPGLDAMAKTLNVTPRAVQRRLAERGYSFKGLLDEVRAKLATTYLLETKLSVTEVAYLLGYSEPSAFNRAFRRWTRSSPAAFRAGQKPARDSRYSSPP